MADVLDNGGQSQEAQQVNDTLIYGTAERLQQLMQLAWEILKRGDQWARGLELGNKQLLPGNRDPERSGCSRESGTRSQKYSSGGECYRIQGSG